MGDRDIESPLPDDSGSGSANQRFLAAIPNSKTNGWNLTSDPRLILETENPIFGNDYADLVLKLEERENPGFPELSYIANESNPSGQDTDRRHRDWGETKDRTKIARREIPFLKEEVQITPGLLTELLDKVPKIHLRDSHWETMQGEVYDEYLKAGICHSRSSNYCAVIDKEHARETLQDLIRSRRPYTPRGPAPITLEKILQELRDDVTTWAPGWRQSQTHGREFRLARILMGFDVTGKIQGITWLVTALFSNVKACDLPMPVFGSEDRLWYVHRRKIRPFLVAWLKKKKLATSDHYRGQPKTKLYRGYRRRANKEVEETGRSFQRFLKVFTKIVKHRGRPAGH